MSHNPPRPPGLSASESKQILEEIARRPRIWSDLLELSGWIAERANAGKRVILTPRTAAIVARTLAVADARPTRDAVALMICWHKESEKCAEPCFACKGRANTVVRAYGQGREEETP